MFPTQVIIDQIQKLLAEDTTMLANTAALKVHLIKANFTPARSVDYTLLTPADFTGSTPKAAGIGNAQTFRDPVTGELMIQLLEPAGGWHWKATDAVSLPQTIFGFVATDNASAVTYGSGKFDTPIIISAANDAVDIPQVRFGLFGPILH